MKKIYVEGETYGDYTLISRESYISKTGKIDQRLYCINNKTGKSVYLHPSGLKNHLKYFNKIKENFDNGLYQMTYRKYMFRTYKKGAINRNLNFDLTFDDFNKIISQDCAYCGSKPSIPTCKRYNKSKIFTNDPDAKFNGIDRIDSSIGYTLNNCVPCCEMCNKMKLNYPKDVFLNHIAQIYNFNKSSTTIPFGSTSEANADGNGVSPN